MGARYTRNYTEPTSTS